MREILFKAKRKDNGKWFEGYYWKKYDFLGNEEHLIFHADSYKVWEYAKIVPETLCQFTGFYDKNGNRIWDNDIVNTNSNLRAQIKFGLYSNSFSTRKYHQGFYMDFMDNEYYRHELGYWAGKSVVIGNVFDNKELLQEKPNE